jgi:hypothetical protein
VHKFGTHPNQLSRLPRLQGGQECTLAAVAQLTSTTTRQVWARPPIDVDFQVLMFTASGLVVRFLKVFEKSDYTAVKWVRYLTKASGTYQIRVRLFVLFVGDFDQASRSSDPETWDTKIPRLRLVHIASHCFLFDMLDVEISTPLKTSRRVCIVQVTKIIGRNAIGQVGNGMNVVTLSGVWA